jgi:glycosyltransferase involved in cell wall biosynthesis
MLRVQDEARWIDRVIRAMWQCCDRIVVFDDDSVDNTVAICESMNATVYRSPFEGLNEAKDKNFLLEKVEELNPDWVLHLDGDEELAPGGAERIRSLTALEFDSYRFHFLYLWDRPDQIRTDGVYRHYSRGSMFRFRPGLRFPDTAHGGNFHCGNVPEPGSQAEADVKILHYGYLHREDRIRKYIKYNKEDPESVPEDRYRHIVQGDVPEVPADMQQWRGFGWAPQGFLQHAGPLRLEPLSEHLIPQGIECQLVNQS